MDSQFCRDCGTVRPASEFTRDKARKDGLAFYCKLHARERLLRATRTYHLKRRYGITAEEADAMLADQNGRCAICRTAPALHVDHDHDSGAVRALLCFNCNGGLGQFRDDPAVLRAAADYVRFHTLSQHLVAVFAAVGIGPVRPIRLEEAPVGSQGRPAARSTGRISGSRRQAQAGEVDQ